MLSCLCRLCFITHYFSFRKTLSLAITSWETQIQFFNTLKCKRNKVFAIRTKFISFTRVNPNGEKKVPDLQETNAKRLRECVRRSKANCILVKSTNGYLPKLLGIFFIASRKASHFLCLQNRNIDVKRHVITLNIM